MNIPALVAPKIGQVYGDLRECVLTEVVDVWPSTADAVVMDFGTQRLRLLTSEYLVDYCRLVRKR